MATWLYSEIWPEDLQRAIGQMVLFSALFDHLAGMFTDKKGLSGKRLRDALGACPEQELQDLGIDYYKLYQERNDFVHGALFMPGGEILRGERYRNSGFHRVTYLMGNIDDLVNGFSSILQRVIQAQESFAYYGEQKGAKDENN